MAHITEVMACFLVLLTIFISINAMGAMHFSKGGGGGGVTITDKKNQLESPVAMGNNGHL